MADAQMEPPPIQGKRKGRKVQRISHDSCGEDRLAYEKQVAEFLEPILLQHDNRRIEQPMNYASVYESYIEMESKYEAVQFTSAEDYLEFAKALVKVFDTATHTIPPKIFDRVGYRKDGMKKIVSFRNLLATNSYAARAVFDYILEQQLPSKLIELLRFARNYNASDELQVLIKNRATAFKTDLMAPEEIPPDAAYKREKDLFNEVKSMYTNVVSALTSEYELGIKELKFKMKVLKGEYEKKVKAIPKHPLIEKFDTMMKGVAHDLQTKWDVMSTQRKISEYDNDYKIFFDTSKIKFVQEYEEKMFTAASSYASLTEYKHVLVTQNILQELHDIQARVAGRAAKLFREESEYDRTAEPGSGAEDNA